jgi:hypothetical protein
MKYNKDEILSAHPLWQSNIKRWKFLINSYMGGADYKDGEYLIAYQQFRQYYLHQLFRSIPIEQWSLAFYSRNYPIASKY